MTPLNTLKQHLRTKCDRELVDEIAYLYKRFPVVKEYYQGTFFEDEESILSKYKKAIKNQLFPDKGFPKLNLSQAKKEISNFKKVSTNVALLVDLMAYYVEQGILCTCEYGDMYETFYISMENVYTNTLKLASKHNLDTQFKDRFHQMVMDTRNIGWGFHHQLADIYADIYNKHPGGA